MQGDFFPKVYGEPRPRHALPLRHSSLWLRTSAGSALRGDARRAVRQLLLRRLRQQLGGLRASEKRYRESDAFPGLPINEIGGRNYGRAMLEWNLPPMRFRRAGTPGFYATWARPALFATTLVTNMDDSALRRTVTNAGAQIDFRMGVLSRLDLTLSVGYAAAFESGQPARHEGMVSLKVLR